MWAAKPVTNSGFENLPLVDYHSVYNISTFKTLFHVKKRFRDRLWKIKSKNLQKVKRKLRKRECNWRKRHFRQ